MNERVATSGPLPSRFRSIPATLLCNSASFLPSLSLALSLLQAPLDGNLAAPLGICLAFRLAPGSKQVP